jgi:hypothetical protein
MNSENIKNPPRLEDFLLYLLNSHQLFNTHHGGNDLLYAVYAVVQCPVSLAKWHLPLWPYSNCRRYRDKPLALANQSIQLFLQLGHLAHTFQQIHHEKIPDRFLKFYLGFVIHAVHQQKLHRNLVNAHHKLTSFDSALLRHVA